MQKQMGQPYCDSGARHQPGDLRSEIVRATAFGQNGQRMMFDHEERLSSLLKLARGERPAAVGMHGRPKLHAEPNVVGRGFAGPTLRR